MHCHITALQLEKHCKQREISSMTPELRKQIERSNVVDFAACDRAVAKLRASLQPEGDALATFKSCLRRVTKLSSSVARRRRRAAKRLCPDNELHSVHSVLELDESERETHLVNAVLTPDDKLAHEHRPQPDHETVMGQCDQMYNTAPTKGARSVDDAVTKILANNDEADLSDEHRARVRRVVEAVPGPMLREHACVLEKGHKPVHVDHRKDVEPEKLRAFGTQNPIMRREMLAEVERMVRRGQCVQGDADWVSPAFAIAKRGITPGDTTTGGASVRVLIDARNVNEKALLNVAQPVLSVDEIWSQIGASRADLVSCIDLRDFYPSIPIDEESQQLFGFVIAGVDAVYRMTSVPQGCKTGPAIATRFLISKLREALTPEEFAQLCLYYDDLTVFTLKDYVEHERLLKKVFGVLDDIGLLVSANKACLFVHKGSVRLLGSRFTPALHQIAPAHDTVSKIAALAEKRPTCARDVKVILGACQFFSQLMPAWYKLAEPLIAMTRKRNTFNWTDKEQDALMQIVDTLRNEKHSLCSRILRPRLTRIPRNDESSSLLLTPATPVAADTLLSASLTVPSVSSSLTPRLSMKRSGSGLPQTRNLWRLRSFARRRAICFWARISGWSRTFWPSFISFADGNL